MKLTRTLLKSITWRLIATGTTASIVYLRTGDVEFTVTVGLLDAGVKIILYMLHDYLWDRKQRDEEIR